MLATTGNESEDDNMNVPTITMDRDLAKDAYREYRQACRNNPNEADRVVMMGYKAMAQGRAIINLHDAFVSAGLDDKGRPKLAIARATWEWIRFQFQGWKDVARFEKAPVNQWNNPFYRIPISAFPAERTKEPWRAMVPMIPPSIRPASSLNDYHILWEAEWQTTPPRDPLLLKKLNGSLYVVLAVWDLTELERAVLGAVRLQQQPLR
jgi:hypothetical protein